MGQAEQRSRFLIRSFQKSSNFLVPRIVNRRLPLTVFRFDGCSVLEQKGDDRNFPSDHRSVKGRVAFSIVDVWICPVFEQDLRDICVSKIHRAIQRCLPNLIGRIRIRATFQQGFSHISEAKP